MHAALARRGVRVDQGWVDAAARAGCTTEEQLFVQFLAHDLRAAATAPTLPRPLGDTGVESSPASTARMKIIFSR